MATKKSRLSSEKSTLITRLMTIANTATIKATMVPSELAKVIAIVAADIGKAGEMSEAFPRFWEKIAPHSDYYSLDVDWFAAPVETITVLDLISMIDCGRALDDDFLTYLKCLTELHQRRRKFGLILQRQPLPTMVQVSPRALMEFGSDFPPEALASWLTWRKFFYDLDNRSAQETGYVFEPILAAAIGGEPKSAKELVVRRRSAQKKGRQVDCWKIRPDGTPVAYEFKLRVTIAASGQGRFAEELSFAEDCQGSGATPILVVLDPTENDKLTSLQLAYRNVGGEAYIGKDAWSHPDEQAGETMGKFIERYVRMPVDAVTVFENAMGGNSTQNAIKLLDIGAKLEGNALSITIGQHIRQVERHEDPAFESDTDESDDDD